MCCISVYFLRHALFPEQCHANIKVWAGVMTFLNLINGILCIIMAGVLYYYRQRMTNEYYIWSIALGRLRIMTRTASSKLFFYIVHAQDIISGIVILFGWPLFKTAASCDEGYGMFYLICMVYESSCVIRVIISVIHFRYGQTIYRKLKRQFASLNTAEYGRGIELDVYYGKDYIQLAKRIRPGDRRYSESITGLNLDDLTCSICLDGFELRPDQDPDHPDGKLVNLPCSI